MPRALAIAAALVLLCLRPAAASEALVLSDMHFNPLADAALGDSLAGAPAARWAAILDRGGERMSSYGQDTDWTLLRAALAAIAAQPKPGLVLIPGDFLAHGFRAKFDAGVAEHGDAAYRRFVAETMRFLALQLAAAFPGTPILPALGNNDSACGDYALRPGGPFLAATEASVAALIGPAAGDSFAASWRALGNYAVPNPVARGETVIALNDIFFSPRYRNSCGTAADGDPARATLAWLGTALAAAARAQRKVLLVYHIPPGIDAYASARRAACPLTPVPMLAPADAAAFHDLLARYRRVIVASVAGHVHSDDFRLLRERGAIFGFVAISPALSPIFGQNPAFRRLRLDADGTIADETTYYLADLAAAAAGGRPRWRAERSFTAAWSLPRFDARGLAALYRRIGRSPAARAQWIAAYHVQSDRADPITARNFAIYRCALGSDSTAEVARCACRAP